ncbi:MAG: hypothetical protein WBG46_09455 [Nonlabens sp.]
MIDKTTAITVCKNVLQERIARNKSRIEELKESLEDNDSSKNADDDDGSGELMADFERANKMLDEAQKAYKDFEATNWSRKSMVCQGALVLTDSLQFLVSISLGELSVNSDEKYYVISQKAPLFLAMEGKTEGEVFEFNKKSYKIMAVS